MSKDRIFIRDFLEESFEEIKAKDFYREIFPAQELEMKGVQEQGKYNAIAVELMPTDESKSGCARAKHHIINDDLARIDTLLESDNFVIISPISYAGKSRNSKNARFIYAMAIDLDGITDLGKIRDLIHQMSDRIQYLPNPTYIVWSGSGVHLYYLFKTPLPCFKNIMDQLAELKKELTKRIWNGFVTEFAGNPQIESIFQGFRMVGSITNGGNRTSAYKKGDKVSIEYLNEFVPEKSRMREYAYKSSLTLEEAAEKYPEWYDKRIIQKQERGHWIANRAVYDWWLRELKSKITVGHRYYGVMVLAIYAKKCGIDYEELSNDAFGLVDFLDGITTDPENHFTRDDVLAALEMYNDSYITFPIKSISALTAIHIEKNKRNHRPQALHLKIARNTKAILKEAGLLKPEGRPKGVSVNKDVIVQWRKDNPEGTVKECRAATGISQSTIYRYWKIGAESNEGIHH